MALLRPGKCTAITIFVACGIALSPIGSAPLGAQVDERKVMAAFLFNFAKFVRWPKEAFAEADSPIEIAVLQDEEFSEVVEAVVGKKLANGRAIRVNPVSTLDETGDAHVVFLPETKSIDPEKLSELGRTHLLTVADAENFAREGGMVSFVRRDNKLRFEINEGAARNAGLAVSSRLLRLAREVH